MDIATPERNFGVASTKKERAAKISVADRYTAILSVGNLVAASQGSERLR